MTQSATYLSLARGSLPSVLGESSLSDAGTFGTASHSPSSVAGGLSAFLCLPFLRLSRNCPRKLLVGQPFTGDAFHDSVESFAITDLPTVVPERFFINIPEQVEGLNTDVGALDSPFQEAPEVLNAVGVNHAPDVFLGVVDNLMSVVGADGRITSVFIGVDNGSRLNAPANGARQGSLASALDYLSVDCAVTVRAMPFQESHNGGLASSSTTLDYFLAFAVVHESRFTTDVGLINFHFSGHAAEVPVLHGKANPMEHEPSGLLGDADGPGDFVGTDAVLGTGNHPDCGQPLVQTDGATLEDGANLDGELPLGVFGAAFPDAARRDETNIIASTIGTGDYSIGPAEADHKIQANIRVCEVADCLKQGLRFVHHDSPFVTTRVP